MDKRDEIREKALKDLQHSEVLMVDGHFDYGNGYHGRVYLNPHQLFRHPSTIWRFAQDLIDCHARPSSVSGRGRRRPGDRRRAARAHIAGSARQPAQPDASAVQLRAVPLRPRRRLHAARLSIARELNGKRVCWPTSAEYRRDVRALRRARSQAAGRRPCWRRVADLRSHWKAGSHRSAACPNIALRRIPSAPEQLQVADCPLCAGGSMPITRF